jgi:Fe-S-cluster containining protein
VVTDLAEIRRLATCKETENLDFRRYLKAHSCPEEPFHVLASEIEKQIDCRQCANCCRHTVVTVTEADIGAIAGYLKMPVREVVRLYTTTGPSGPSERILNHTGEACTFLDGNLCMIYEARPRVCRDFPHASLRARSLGGRMESLCRRASICPIAFNAIERYKQLIGYRSC